MVNRIKHVFFHASSFYIIWFFCLTTAAKHQSWIGVGVAITIITIQMLWQYKIAKDTNALIRLIVILTLSAILVESLMMSQNIVQYHDNVLAPYLPPPWIIVLWIEFAIVIHAIMKNLWDRPFVLSFLSLLGFPIVYLAGEHLGAATLPYGWQSALIIGVVWAILLPAIVYNHHQKVSSL